MPQPERHLNPDGTVALNDDQPDEYPPHLAPAAIAGCTMCDPDGYRNGIICDHIDHAPAAARGIAACRAALKPPAANTPRTT